MSKEVVHRNARAFGLTKTWILPLAAKRDRRMAAEVALGILPLEPPLYRLRRCDYWRVCLWRNYDCYVYGLRIAEVGYM
jgi:hypothetical protein